MPTDSIAAGETVVLVNELITPLIRPPGSPESRPGRGRGAVILRHFRAGDDTALGLSTFPLRDEDCLYELRWEAPRTPGRYRVELSFLKPPPGLSPGDPVTREDFAPYMDLEKTAPQHVIARGEIQVVVSR